VVCGQQRGQQFAAEVAVDDHAFQVQQAGRALHRLRNGRRRLGQPGLGVRQPGALQRTGVTHGR
jgi:hypothetical protein